MGRILGGLTIPMALLTLASVCAAIWLALFAETMTVATSLLVLLAGLVLSWIIDGLIAQLEDAALAAQTRWGDIAGGTIALICGALPMLVIILWLFAAFQWLNLGEANAVAWWLLSYGIATGPWTLHALFTADERRTLCGIRAWAAGVAFLLLSAVMWANVASPLLALAAMAIPAILPGTVGTLLARADRTMLRAVRL